MFNKAYPNPNDILGEQTVNIRKSIPNIPKQINDMSQSIVKTIDQTKTSTTEKIDNIIYSTTVKPIVEKIHTLPENQQKEIKKEICR